MGSPRRANRTRGLLYGHSVVMLLDTSDDSLRTKPEPQQQTGRVIALADRDQQLRHEAARRLAERHTVLEHRLLAANLL